MTTITEADLMRKCKDRITAEQVEQSTSAGSKFILQCLADNEDGDARLFNKIHQDRFIYDHAAGVWYEWAGHFWREDFRNKAMAGIDDVIEAYATEANRQAWAATKEERAGHSDKAKKHLAMQDALLKRVRQLQTAKRKRNVMFLATVGMGLRGDEWDRLDRVIACSNGVIDLRTGTHRPGRQDDYIKTACLTEWRGIDEPCPTWDRFLSEVFAGDQELIDYAQRLLGYGASGTAIMHILVILWGVGRNGKGTLLEALKHVLGDLAYKTESELLLEQKAAKLSGAPNSGLLALRGKRIIFASESDDGRRLNTSKVKELTGGDTLNARALYCRHHVEFRPSHLLLLLTNHRPQAPATDYALWQRIHLIAFTQSFVFNPTKPNEHKADPDLPAKLQAEASGILAWLVRGCMEWQSQGLNPPDVVMAATKQYQAEEDLIGHFIDERCKIGKGYQVKAGELYKSYRVWADDNGYRPLSGKRFGQEMQVRFDSYKTNYVFYMGIQLIQI